MDGFVDRFYPGRSKLLRAPNSQEFKATTFIMMEIEQASGKIRETHVGDEEEDYELPIWAARYPVHQVIGAAEPCPRQHPDAEIPPGMAPYRPGRRLDEVMTETYHANYSTDG
jgi:hypothetical protein